MGKGEIVVRVWARARPRKGHVSIWLKFKFRTLPVCRLPNNYQGKVGGGREGTGRAWDGRNRKRQLSEGCWAVPWWRWAEGRHGTVSVMTVMATYEILMALDVPKSELNVHDIRSSRFIEI
jgi:hypothetical protein